MAQNNCFTRLFSGSIILYLQLNAAAPRLGYTTPHQAMATGPVLGYVLQSRLILQNRSVGAFSTDICLVLLIANILRLNFYLFQQYELALLFQSLFMISAQLVLLYICCLYKHDSKQEEPVQETMSEKFWRWSQFTPYWQYTLVFFVVTFTISTIMWAEQVKTYGVMVGLISLLIESMLIVPQILEIFKQQDAMGISYGLIGLNLFGDTYKTFYFFSRRQSFQFKICGIIQLILDGVVIAQIVYYRLRYRFSELPDEGNGEKKEQVDMKKQQYNTAENNQQLEGSLSATIVVQEQVENVGSKPETQTALQ